MQGCITRLANLAFALLLIAVILAGAAYFFALPQLDEKLADALRREFILPPSSDVFITRGSLLDTVEGQFDMVYAKAEEAKIDGLIVENLEFIAEGVEFNLPETLLSGQAALTSLTRGSLSFRVSEEALEDRWRSELSRKGLSEVEVSINDDGIGVSGLIDFGISKVKIGVTGEIGVDDGKKLTFRAKKLNLGGTSIGLESVKAIFSALAPVIDLGKFKLAVSVDELRTGDGYIYLKARTPTLEEKAAAMRGGRGDIGEGLEGASRTKFKLPSLEEVIDVFTEEDASEYETGVGGATDDSENADSEEGDEDENDAGAGKEGGHADPPHGKDAP
ncbi:LmeA family phospholipid-binding protein [bacterium]|nr:LmeA family phospholipid-binding protein [bacterium]